MGNPFFYSKESTKNDLVGRDLLVASLIDNLTQNRHTLVEAPFGWGKTCLIKKSLDRLPASSQKTFLSCWIDCVPFRNEKTFYQSLIRAVAQCLAMNEPWHQLASKFLQQSTIPFSFRTQEQSFDLQLFDIDQHYAEILDVIQQMTQKQPLILCLDNFESLDNVNDPKRLSQRIRSVWQHHKQVTYCFISRPRDFLLGLFESNPASFHSFGEIIHLQKPESTSLADFVKRKFHDTGKDIEQKHALAIVNHMQSHPYYTQQLAHVVWEQTHDKVYGSTIIQGLEAMLARQAILFERIIDDTSNSQFSFLKALASGLKSGFTKQQVISRFDLGSSANVVKVQRALVKKEVISSNENGFQFLDPAFALWFKWNILK